MGQTLVEKILSRKLGEDVKAGDLVVCDSDFTFIHDFSGPLTLEQLEEIETGDELPHPERIAVFFDHASPSSSKSTATDQKRLREWVRDVGGQLFEVGGGVSHVQIAEKIAAPGKVILGADSHTCMAGALGCFATGMGSTDIAGALATGKTWLKVPETIRVEVNGELPEGVFAKDLVLTLIGKISQSGATYKSVEWGGETVENLPMHERLVLTNMGIESGAKCAMIKSDEETRRYLADHGREDEYTPVEPDSDAQYEQVIEFNAEEMTPVVSVPHAVDNVEPISQVADEGVEIDQIYMGTCTNGRFEDFKMFSDILEGEMVHPGVRIVCTPGSREVYKKGLEAGIWDKLIDAGAVVNSPGCGACPGVHTGILGDGEVCLSSQNRNYKGRMGNPDASIYLASPATCGYSAIRGRISDPGEYFREKERESMEVRG